MKKFNSNALILFTIGFLLLGCKITEISTPTSSVVLPDTYSDMADVAADSLLVWDKFFPDPNLQRLILVALANNQDNRRALEQIRQANAGMVTAKAGLLPQVGAMAGALRRKFGEYTMDGVGNFDSNLSDNIPEDKRIPDPYKDFIVGANFSWEIDVWGKLRSQRKAAIERYLSSVEMSNYVRALLVSEIAGQYYLALALDKEIQILEENIGLQELGVGLVKDLKEGGRANQLAVDQFEALVLNSRALLEAKKRELRSAELFINRLSGKVTIDLTRSDLDGVFDAAINQQRSIPASILQNRPDIRQAEKELLATQGDLGAAKASFYPSITLFGLAGFNAFDFSRLFLSPASSIYQMGAGLTAPVFNRRQIRMAFESAKAGQQIALLNYEQKVLDGYLEVLDLVNQIETYQNQVKLKESEVIVLKQSIENSNTLFSVGYASYLEVITAQSRSLQTQIELAELKSAQLKSNAYLYRALGGGWK